MKIKTILVTTMIFFLFLPLGANAAAEQNLQEQDSFFQARVIEVLEEKRSELPDGRATLQQNLKLRGLEGEYKGEEVVFKGVREFEVISSQTYAPGDKVLVAASKDSGGEDHFYVIGPVRTNALWFLAGIFVFVILAAARWKGLRSLVSLGITLFIIVGYIVPEIMAGSDPIVVTLIGSFFALLAVIYITEGWTPRSHLAVGSIFLSLVFTLFLSWIFIELAQLTGITGEETGLLLGSMQAGINYKGLLLAGIVIGSLGVLDDMVISQVATTEEIYKANNYLTRSKLFKKAYRVGSSHISSMVNTLFLAYAGASLPLLMIFSSEQSPFSSWQHVVNTEAIATEMVRTLCGSIGLILAVPLATALAVWYYKR